MINKIIITILIFSISINVEAFSLKKYDDRIFKKPNITYLKNDDSSVCEPTNPYYNSLEIVDIDSQNNKDSSVIYDITRVDIEKVGGTNYLNIYGWAFNIATDNILSDSGNNKTSVKLYLGEKNNVVETEDLKFDITYATESDHHKDNGKLNYFDLTYWNCYRTAKDATTGGKCIKNLTQKMQGGFKATLNLDKAKNYINLTNKNKKTYLVYIYVDSNEPPSNSRDVGEEIWFPLAISKTVVDSSIDSFNISDKEIDITGFSSTAKIKVDEARLLGNNGLYCNSPAAENGLDPSLIFYKKNASYNVIEKKLAYRGENKDKYYQTLYGLKTSKANQNYDKVDGGNDWTSYAPASWLRFTGEMKLEFVKKVENVKRCEDGSVPYNNYYNFLLPITKNDLIELNGGSFKTSGSNSIFNDTEIFNNLVPDNPSNVLKHIKILEKSPIDINSSNVKEFYDTLIDISAKSEKYIKKGANDYYLTHTKWCYEDGTCTPTNGDTLIEKGSNFFAERTIRAKKYTVDPLRNNTNTGFNFNVERQMYPYNEVKDNMVHRNPKTDGMYYHPIRYKISYCVSHEEVAECEDDVKPAECYDTDTGTKVVFHENNDLNACTLGQNNHSGFTIVSNEESNNYCEVACKDDIDMKLPTSKFAKAGRYFVLNNYQPEIEITRTCVTSKINYSQFESDLINAENEMVNAYNLWQDWKYFDENYKSEEVPSKNQGNTKVCTDDTSKKCDWGYTVYKFVTDSMPPNKTLIEEEYKDGSSDCEPCNDTKTTATPTKTKKEKDIDDKVKETKKDYDDAKKKYDNLVQQYKECTNWLDSSNKTKNSSIEKNDGSGDNELKTKPELIFDYDDKDKSAFSVPNKLEINKNDTEYSKKITFWDEQASDETNNYTTGGDETDDLGNKGNLKDITVFNLVGCTGTTCDNNVDVEKLEKNRTGSNKFYTSKYIKRVEKVKYIYSLQRLATIIPSGKITNNLTLENAIKLEENAVPININTMEGNYEYKIIIDNLQDDLRKNSKSKNDDDNFLDRFNNSALNSGSEYICNYNVINDIYKPDDNPGSNNGRLNFFYRVVDPSNINPNHRELGYNWQSTLANKAINRMKENAEDYQVLTNSSERDKFSFTLSPSIMRQIREYNNKRANSINGVYSDWELKCNDNSKDDYHCQSNFLTCLTSGGTKNLGNHFPSCQEIFENTLTNYSNLTDYDNEALIGNRNILINKHKENAGGGG